MVGAISRGVASNGWRNQPRRYLKWLAQSAAAALLAQSAAAALGQHAVPALGVPRGAVFDGPLEHFELAALGG